MKAVTAKPTFECCTIDPVLVKHRFLVIGFQPVLQSHILLILFIRRITLEILPDGILVHDLRIGGGHRGCVYVEGADQPAIRSIGLLIITPLLS